MGFYKYGLVLLFIFFTGCGTVPESKESAQYAADSLHTAERNLNKLKELNESYAELLAKVELFKNNEELKMLYDEFHLRSINLYNESYQAIALLNKISFIIEDKMTARPIRK